MPSLIAFVEAARERSFKRAAQRVHISPSALTRQIQALEAQLGCALFRRTPTGLELTSDGQRYLAATQRSLEALQHAQRALAARSGPLRVSALASFTEQWLIPHLPEFARAHPDIQLEIEATYRYADFDREPVDAAIRFGAGGWGELHAERLLELEVVALCSPRLRDGSPPLTAAGDLAEHTLIHIAQVPGAWASWLRGAGLGELTPRGTLRFDHVALALSAAESDLGVALCPLLLCQRKLDAGVLVRPFVHSLIPAETYHFVCRPDGLRDHRIAALRAWLKGSFAPSAPRSA
jgi:LysR family glycine cleavage system transcriptional activator